MGSLTLAIVKVRGYNILVPEDLLRGIEGCGIDGLQL